MPLLIEHNPAGANIQCVKILRPFLNLMIQPQSSCDVFGGIINIRNTLHGNVSWLAHNRICFINCSSAGGRVRTEVQPLNKKIVFTAWSVKRGNNASRAFVGLTKSARAPNAIL